MKLLELSSMERQVRREWLANHVRYRALGTCERCGSLTEVVRQERGRKFECVDCFDQRSHRHRRPASPIQEAIL